MWQDKFIIKPYRLENIIQHYNWGTKDEDAFIPQLLGFKAQAGKPYAELWMGTHPNGPSKVVGSVEKNLLSELIQSYPNEILGKSVSRKYDNQLPFLFKVLSAAEALSIQAHPSKKQAKKLHQKDSLNYPDDNHKPEIAIAIDELSALVGFRSYDSIVKILNKYPELSEFIGEQVCIKFVSGREKPEIQKKELLKELYSAIILNAEENAPLLEKTLSALEKRLANSKGTLDESEEYFLHLKKQYGSDVGLWSIFLLNLVHLKSGQGVFLDAGIPHAYLKGNIIECMANSDNVVRAGLTPKFKDSKTLLDILDFEFGQIPVLENKELDAIFTYPSAVEEFSVSRILLKSNEKLGKSCNSIQIMLLLSGNVRVEWANESMNFKPGDSIIIPAAMKNYSISAVSDIELFLVEVDL